MNEEEEEAFPTKKNEEERDDFAPFLLKQTTLHEREEKIISLEREDKETTT